MLVVIGGSHILLSDVAMQDLIKYTPTGHVDYDLLQKTLKLARHFLDNLVSPDSVRDNVGGAC
jgi:hypothetical protein